MNLSHPTMGAWIEIMQTLEQYRYITVAPHDGCVDWNELRGNLTFIDGVAPHDGCVDWNTDNKYTDYFWGCRTPRWVRGLKYIASLLSSCKDNVAPHDGCVDWNLWRTNTKNEWQRSHPTMGAWIEIAQFYSFPQKWVTGRTPRWVRGLKLNYFNVFINKKKVAPHDGCVDWNNPTKKWEVWVTVAPHDGCVDWNLGEAQESTRRKCRTPRWVRGLKLYICFLTSHNPFVAPHDGCVDWNFL